MIELCPECLTQLNHIEIDGEDVFGCPKCKKEIAYSDSIKGLE